MGGSVDYVSYRTEQEGVLWPVRLGKKQDDGEAFWVVSCGVLS